MMGIGRLGVLPAQGHRDLQRVWQSEGNCSPQADRPSLFVKHFHSHLMSVPDDPHMRKARLREVKQPAEGHTARKWQKWDVNPALPVFWMWSSRKAWRTPKHLVVSRQDPQPRSQNLSDSGRLTVL